MLEPARRSLLFLPRPFRLVGMTNAIFIRHGQSTANIGLPVESFAGIPLTDLGQQQARAVAESLSFTPHRIVVSPYLRTQQTAAPTIERFPAVAVETWPIHEFTFWDPAHVPVQGEDELMRAIDHYWTTADPDVRFGGGAESFAMFLGRAEAALDRLQTERNATPIVLFTHGHFMQALRLTVLYPEKSAKEKMQMFRAFDAARWVENTEMISAAFDGKSWNLS